jgi:hypothetical protein
MVADMTTSLRKTSIVALVLLLGLVVWDGGTPSVMAAQAVDGEWRAEFDHVSQPASEAMDLTIPQLEGLLTRCESLKSGLTGLDESGRKFYGKRLQMTCDLYRFMLDSKRAAKEAAPPP